MNTIGELGNNITEQLVNGKSLLCCSDILSEYKGDDWKEHVKHSDASPYLKVCAFINEHIEIDVLSWKSARGSKIHDHPSKGCLLKIMSGYLIENIYVKKNDEIKFVETKQLNTNHISYKCGDSFLHNIDNPTEDYSVSLHVYSPPNYKLNYY